MRRGRRLLSSGSLGLVVLGAVLGLATRPTHADRSYDNLHDRAIERTRAAEQAAAAGDPARANELGRQALELLQTADGLRPTDPRVPFLAVQAAVYAGEPAASREWLARFRQRSGTGPPTAAHHYLDAFVAYHLERRADLAIASLQRMQALDPWAMTEARELLYFNALLLEGTRLAEAREFLRALSLLDQAARLARREGSTSKLRLAREKTALVLQMDERYEEAEEIFLALLKDDPENAFWQWRLGVNRANRNLWAQAIPPYEEALRLLEAGRLSPRMAAEVQVVYLRLGNSLRNLAGVEIDPARRVSLFERARERIAQYVRVAPRDLRGHYWMGWLLYQDLDRPHDAIPWFRRAYAIDPVCDHSLRSLIQIYEHNDPLPVGDEARQARDREAWMAQLEAWEAEERAFEKERAAERLRREDLRHDSGCE